MEGITKSFGGVPVLDGVALALAARRGPRPAGRERRGQVDADERAGRHLRCRRGRDPYRRRAPVHLAARRRHARTASAWSISTSGWWPAFTASENLLACRVGPGRAMHVDQGGRPTQLRETWVTGIGLAVEPDTAVRDLSIAERQRVEILKVLVAGARILILDEPTAVLTDQEADRLCAGADTGGAGARYRPITHKLREVIAACDRVSVMRAGRITLRRS